MRNRFMLALAAGLALSACGGHNDQNGGSGLGNGLTGPSNPPAQAHGSLAFSTTASRGWSSIEVMVDGQYIGSLTHYYSNSNSSSSCAAQSGARVVAPVTPGTHYYTAYTDVGGSWSGTIAVSSGGCREVILTCSNNDCSQ